ncbi:MAG: sigma-70 family RNA polymerase sigma factor [Pseudonocardia sp.]|nr:sigma-70 family RNA polymerase sigma factor [Pseudonocardia sp.]
MSNGCTQHSTTELVEAAGRGLPQAWDELVTRYGGFVRAVAARYRLQEADAADAVQNTWLRALERLPSLHDPERLGGWLATIASRECLALIRRARRELPDGDVAVDVAVPGPGPETLVLAAEIRAAVGAAVADLPAPRRELIDHLFYRTDHGYRAVARALDMPTGSIGPTRGRVLATLQSTLESAGFGLTA